MSNILKTLAAGSASEPTDEYFNQTTLLLHGDGTNGAQNNTFLDSSTNNFTITRNGNTTQGTFSPFSNADGEWSNYFDGSGDELTIPDNVALDLQGGDFTVELWVYTTSLASAQQIIGSYQDASGGYRIKIQTNGTVTAHLSGDGIDITSTTALSTNDWYHIALSGTPSSSVKLFINGVQEGSTFTGTTSLNSNQVLRIGNYRLAAEYFSGYISNVRIVKGTALYTSAFTPPTAPLTAISGTSLLTCQSNRFVDNSSNAFAITVTGNTSVQPFSPFAPSAAYSPSVNGGSGYFDGSGDYLAGPTANSAFDMGSGDWTIETWAYPRSLSTNMAVFVASDAAVFFNALSMLINTTGSVTVYQRGASSYFINSTSTTGVITANAWSHIVAVRSGGDFATFVNGTRVATVSSVSGTQVSNNVVGIGQDPYNGGVIRYNGDFSSMRVVKGTAVYDPTQTTLTMPTAPLTAVSGTSLLLNFTNAGIFDSTAKNDLETVGNAQVDTSVVKYGTGSMKFDGTGDYLFARHTPEWLLGSGDFTVEFWLNMDSGTSTAGVIAPAAYADTTGTWSVILDSNTLYWQGYTGLTNVISASYTSYKGAWTHVAFVRSSGTIRIYLNGTSSTSTTDSNTYSTAPATGWTIGYQARNNYYLTGYIDDLRITKGVARYTANFTPPDKEFPNL